MEVKGNDLILPRLCISSHVKQLSSLHLIGSCRQSFNKIKRACTQIMASFIADLKTTIAIIREHTNPQIKENNNENPLEVSSV